MKIENNINCTLCPRNCKVNRGLVNNKAGFCGEFANVRVAFAGLHFGEEPCLCSAGGSGTVFFTGCTLKCSFCQNIQISREGIGRAVSEEELADIFLKLQGAGADNINLVTGTQFVPGIINALMLAKNRGLKIPVAWNTSGYESSRTLEVLNQYIDIYLTDIKTLNGHVSAKYFNAGNYPDKVKAGVKKMVLNSELCYREESLVKGTIIRHLVLPGELESTKEVLLWIKKHFDKRALLSLMFQYIPVGSGPERRVTRKEYDTVLCWLNELGLDNGYVQEYGSEDTENVWLPDFTKVKPFSSELCKGVWHYAN